MRQDTPRKITGSTVRLRLGAELHATVAGRSRGPAPNASVAALALCLARTPHLARERAGLAREVYPFADPISSRTALRQTLRRLRYWLGDGVLSITAKTIAARGTWLLDPVAESRLGAGSAYDHPFFKRIDLAPNPVPFDESRPLDGFADTVRYTAGLDIDSARAVLLGARSFTQSLPLRQCRELLSLTKPHSRRDPLAFEHCELDATVHMQSGEFGEARRAIQRGLRIATHARRHRDIVRANVWGLFLALESGDLETGRGIVSFLQPELHRHRMLVQNGMVAYHWNTGEIGQALELAKSMEGPSKGEPRLDRLHFWSNSAVLAAEAGDDGFFERALGQAEALLLPGLDAPARANLTLALAIQLRSVSPEDSVRTLLKERARYQEKGWTLHALYLSEALALSRLAAGDLSGAASTWQSASLSRRQLGCRPTPRLLAMKRRITFGEDRWSGQQSPYVDHLLVQSESADKTKAGESTWDPPN